MVGTIGLYGGISLNKNDENVVRDMNLAASVCVCMCTSIFKKRIWYWVGQKVH